MAPDSISSRSSLSRRRRCRCALSNLYFIGYSHFPRQPSYAQDLGVGEVSRARRARRPIRSDHSAGDAWSLRFPPAESRSCSRNLRHGSMPSVSQSLPRGPAGSVCFYSH
jgi:hypothetical protein